MNILKKIKKINKQTEEPWYRVYKLKGINPKIQYDHISMYERISKTANKYPNNMAYSYFNTNSTYKKFIKDIDITAKAFQNIGVKEKEIVTICMPNTPEALMSFYALNKIGAIVNMVHPLSSENEIKKYLLESESEIILAVDLVSNKIDKIKCSSQLKKIIYVKVSDSMDFISSVGYWLLSGRKNKKIYNSSEILFWKDFFHLGKNLINNKEIVINPYDPAVILHSGGTTGKPKGIVLSSDAFNAVVETEMEVCKDLTENVTILSAMPIFHGFGLGSTIHAPLCAGATCILLPQLNAKKFGDTINKYKPNIIACVPSLYETMVNSIVLKNKNLKYIKCAICGGDKLSLALKQKVDMFFREHNSDTKVRAAFGMTECISGVTMMPKNSDVDDGIGIPCPHTSIKIVAPSTHNEVPFGEKGEICVNGPSVMIGYLNDPKETFSVLQIHDDNKTWLHTGDLGSMDKNGYVYFEQRLKRIIVSNGYNIYPSQIEHIIETHPDVLSCTVIGINHPHKVQVPKAFIVLKEGCEESLKIKKSIQKLCEDNIAAYALPYEYEFRKKLPMTLVGKVAIKQLEDEENVK